MNNDLKREIFEAKKILTELKGKKKEVSLYTASLEKGSRESMVLMLRFGSNLSICKISTILGYSYSQIEYSSIKAIKSLAKFHLENKPQ